MLRVADFGRTSGAASNAQGDSDDESAMYRPHQGMYFNKISYIER
jgi:hypothetical protein